MNVMELFHGKEYVRIVKTHSPNLSRGLNLHQIVEKLTSRRKKEIYEVCWKERIKDDRSKVRSEDS